MNQPDGAFLGLRVEEERVTFVAGMAEIVVHIAFFVRIIESFFVPL